MNSLKFNEVDWTIVVKKVSKEEINSRKAEAEKALKAIEEKRKEAERVAKEKAEAKAKADAEVAQDDADKSSNITKPIQRKRAVSAKKKGK
jgi:membrane protein involved in colicin uptake